MSGLFRDIIMIAIGLNLGLMGFAVALGLDSLLWLGAMNLALCAFGVTVTDYLKDKNEENDNE